MSLVNDIIDERSILQEKMNALDELHEFLSKLTDEEQFEFLGYDLFVHFDDKLKNPHNLLNHISEISNRFKIRKSITNKLLESE